MSHTVLVIDDEKNIRRTLQMVLESADLHVIGANSAEEALQIAEDHEPDVVLLDVRLPGMSGIQAIRAFRSAGFEMPIIMISGHSTISEAIDALRQGATDFLEKPLDRNRVLVSVQNALRTWSLEKELRSIRENTEKRYEMVGKSEAMRRLFEEIEKVAPTRSRVLIIGESGTGKELVARAIHRLSPRANQPFVKVNCAAIPSELIESELFGHEKGAFTGATSRKQGLFELAHRGTLFLDEIGDMSLSAQAKLLRVLQSGEFTRVGGERPISVDVRIIAATNKDLESAIEKGVFREDLYFRLNVIPIRTPPLRERPEDIPLLVAAFVQEFAKEHGIPPKPIDPEVFDVLAERSWPGNVRELRNLVERMLILSDERITIDDIPELPEQELRRLRKLFPLPQPEHREHKRESLKSYRERAEREYILSTLREVDWNISKAALLLGVERTNLHKKLKVLGIRREDEGGPKIQSG
ncbi:MAG: sigma-54 dependent transcriptional regulator [Sandaracinaceae bacterium]|nr:sigma-54 dependent transcriptional regulator [Sandaracinaceae bacterium]